MYKNMSIKACKLFLSLIILYSGYYLVFFSPIPNMMYILGGIMLVFLFISVIVTSTPLRHFINLEIILWLLFGFTSFVFAHYIAYNAGYSNNAIFKFFENMAFIITICYICRYDSNCNFMIKLYLFYALLCAITSVLMGHSFTERLDFSNTMGANSLGIVMFNGIFCVLYKLDLKKYLKMVSWWKKIITVLVGIVVISIVAIKFTPLFLESNMYARIIGNDTAAIGGDEIRRGLYSEAIHYFKQNPVFGIGYKNFELVSSYQMYSHSTYAELLACAGITGFLLYIFPLVLLFKKLFMIIFNKDIKLDTQNKARIVLVFLVLMIFLGFGMIHFYEIQSTIMFGIIISFTLVYSKTRRKVENE